MSNLILNILAKDKTKAALTGVRNGLNNLRTAVFSLQSAIVGIGGGLAIRSLTKVGSEVEDLGVRFNFLFGNVEQGTKAFDNLVDFAARVPFSLQEISAASGNLAVVAKDADDLTRILKITGNVAAVTGLDFALTATQIQRSFAGGIAAADVFRERGVRALLGFKAGATITAEATIKAFEDTFGEGGRFGKATEVLATTFTGTLSMLSDKLFKFKLETNRAGFFDFFKNALVVINRGIEDNSKALTQFSTAVGEGLVNFIKQALLGGAALLDILRPIFQAVAIGIGGLIDVVKGLPPGIRELGIVGFLMLGRTGKIAIVGILGLLKAIGVDLDKITNSIFGATKQTEEFGPAMKSVNMFIKKIEENIILSKKQLAELQKELKKVEETAKKTGVSFEKIKDAIKNQIKKDLESVNETIGKFILKGVDDFSRALAEAVVLGKELKMSFEELAKKLLVEIVAFSIKLTIQLGIQKLLEGTIFDIFKKQREQCEDLLGIKIKDATVESVKLALMKQQTAEMEKQKKIKGTTMLMSGNPLGFLGFMASGGSVGKGQPTIVGEKGPELFIPNSSGQITQNARGMGGRSANVTFNINTIDSRGFDQALVENRGTITAIINNALTERGRGELV